VAKVINAKTWQLVPASDGRRYSTYPDGNIPAGAAAWSLPATISVNAGSSVGVRQYATNAADWTIAVTGLPTGLSYNSGTESIDAAGGAADASATATFTLSKVGETDIVDTASTVAVASTATRDDILLTWDASTFTADEFNDSQLDTASHQRQTDGYWVNVKLISDFAVDQNVKDLPHLEAKAGAHVVEGDRAYLLTVYGADYSPHVPYEIRGGTDGLARIDMQAAKSQRVLYGVDSADWGPDARFTTNRGYKTELWIGFAMYWPSDFVFENNAGCNHSFFSFGFWPNAGLNSWLEVSIPVEGGDPRLRIRLKDTITNNPLVSYSRTLTESFKGQHQFFVINAFVSDLDGESYCKVWHHLASESPTLVVNSVGTAFGIDPASYVANSGSTGFWGNSLKLSNYRSGIPNIYPSAWNGSGTPGPTADKSIVVGFDSFRFAGNNSNFKSVHPLMLDEPV